MSRNRVLALGCAVVLAACGRPDRGEGPYGDRVARYAPQIERALGMPFKTPPRLEVRTRQEVREFLLRRLDEPHVQSALEGEEAMYKILGLIHDTLDLRAFFIPLLTEQILGYYDPETKVLYVVEGAPDEYIGLTIMHELVHALQDQYVDLDSIQRATGNNDRQVAAQAVIEGQATYEQVLLMIGGRANLAARLPAGWMQMRDMIRDAQESQPVFAGAPLVIREGLLFPYINGAEFVRRFADRRPGEQPLDDLPVSTEQVLHGRAYFGAQRDEPIEVTLPPVSGSFYENTMGEFATRLFFYHHLRDTDAAARAAMGWGGDRYVVVRTPRGPGVAWVIAWDTALDAAVFVSAVDDVMRARFQLPGPTAGPGGARRYATAARTVHVSTRDIGGVSTVLYVDVPAGVDPAILPLGRVALSR